MRAVFQIKDILLCPHMMRGEKAALWGTLNKDTNPIYEGFIHVI